MDIYVGLIPIITRFHGDCQAISVEFCRWAGGSMIKGYNENLPTSWGKKPRGGSFRSLVSVQRAFSVHADG